MTPSPDKQSMQGSGAPSDDLLAFCITETLGERCKDFDPDCYTCQAWLQYDGAKLAAAPEAATPSPDAIKLAEEMRERAAEKLDEAAKYFEKKADLVASVEGAVRYGAVAEALRLNAKKIRSLPIPAAGEREKEG